jgi:hypothetical protein
MAQIKEHQELLLALVHIHLILQTCQTVIAYLLVSTAALSLVGLSQVVVPVFQKNPRDRSGINRELTLPIHKMDFSPTNTHQQHHQQLYSSM